MSVSNISNRDCSSVSNRDKREWFPNSHITVDLCKAQFLDILSKLWTFVCSLMWCKEICPKQLPRPLWMAGTFTVPSNRPLHMPGCKESTLRVCVTPLERSFRSYSVLWPCSFSLHGSQLHATSPVQLYHNVKLYDIIWYDGNLNLWPSWLFTVYKGELGQCNCALCKPTLGNCPSHIVRTHSVCVQQQLVVTNQDWLFNGILGGGKTHRNEVIACSRISYKPFHRFYHLLDTVHYTSKRMKDEHMSADTHVRLNDSSTVLCTVVKPPPSMAGRAHPNNANRWMEHQQTLCAGCEGRYKG